MSKSKSPERVLGVAAKGDIDEPDVRDATVQPGLKETDERAGKTLEEQAAADLRAEQRAAKAAEKEKN